MNSDEFKKLCLETARLPLLLCSLFFSKCLSKCYFRVRFLMKRMPHIEHWNLTPSNNSEMARRLNLNSLKLKLTH